MPPGVPDLGTGRPPTIPDTPQAPISGVFG